MTVRAIAGLLLFDLALVATGLALLYGLRGLRSWMDALRLAGLAFLLGFSSVATVLTALLALGIPFGPVTVTAACLSVVAVGAVLGIVTGRPRPFDAPPRPRLPRLSLASALFVAAFALYFEALFRATRLAAQSEWDAWRCWSIRPKAIWFFDGFDTQLFGAGAPRCPGYPPGLATIEASAFEAMGSVDVVTYTLQSWVLALAFVGAVAGLLAPRVRGLLLLPFLLLAVVLPSVKDRIADGRADLALAYLMAVATVLVCLWLDDRRSWRLAAAAVLMAGAILTKREGLLLVACVLLAALVASAREWRAAWPRLIAVGLAAYLLAVPWRIWLALEGGTSGAPPDGYLGLLDQLDRAWPSLRLVVEALFSNSLWVVAVPLALGAAALALLAGVVRVPVFMVSFVVIAVAACTWAIWAEPDLEITRDYGLNPVVRLVGGPILILTAIVPLSLELGWARSTAGFGAGHPRFRALTRPRRTLPWLIVAVAALGYPLSALTGVSALRLPGGMPRFPSADECQVAPGGDELRVVLGYTSSYTEADEVRARGSAAGVTDARIGQDGCGRLRVYVDGVTPTRAQELVGSLRSGGLDASVEGASGE